MQLHPASAYNPVVRCHAGKTAGFVPAERHLTFPSYSANGAECGPNGSRTSDPTVCLARILARLLEEYRRRLFAIEGKEEAA